MSQLIEDIRDERLFSGGMDKDSSPHFIQNGDYIDALNMTKNGEGRSGVLSKMNGNTLVSGVDSDDRDIGECYYAKENKHILIYPDRIDLYDYGTTRTTVLDSTQIINQDFLSIEGDYVSFSIIDDWLAWTDRVNRPRMINIQDAIGGKTYSLEDLTMGIAPP